MMRLFARCTLIALALSLCLPCIAQEILEDAPKSTITKKVLDNGLTVVVKPERGSGLVAIVAMVRTGANQESVQTAGIGNFVAQMLLAGTRMSSAEEVAAVADQVGGNLSTQWGPDVTELRTVTTSAMFNRAMSLMGESLTRANFEQKWVDQVRATTIRQLNAHDDNLFDSSYSTLRSLLYEDNGYGRAARGSERTAKMATAADLMKFYTSYYAPNNMVISIVGDVGVDQAMDRVRRAFGTELYAKLPVNRGVPDETLDRCKLKASEVDIQTAYLLCGWLAPGVISSDYPATAIAVNALGGGKGSLMFRELRQKRGMGYEVGAIYPRYKYQSHIMAYVITDPFKDSAENVNPSMVLDEVKTALLEQVEALKSKPLSQVDLDRAKGYTIGSYALSHQRLVDRAYELGWLEASGAGYKAYTNFASVIEKVTAAEVQRAAQRYFTNYAAVLLLPKSNLQKSAEGKE